MGEFFLNAVLILIIVAIVGSAIAYIIKEKKRGARCIGCSASGCKCSSKDKNTGCSKCSGH